MSASLSTYVSKALGFITENYVKYRIRLGILNIGFSWPLKNDIQNHLLMNFYSCRIYIERSCCGHCHLWKLNVLPCCSLLTLPGSNQPLWRSVSVKLWGSDCLGCDMTQRKSQSCPVHWQTALKTKWRVGDAFSPFLLILRRTEHPSSAVNLK